MFRIEGTDPIVLRKATKPPDQLNASFLTVRDFHQRKSMSTSLYRKCQAMHLRFLIWSPSTHSYHHSTCYEFNRFAHSAGP